jgi:hypothetical protein
MNLDLKVKLEKKKVHYIRESLNNNESTIHWDKQQIKN